MTWDFKIYFVTFKYTNENTISNFLSELKRKQKISSLGLEPRSSNSKTQALTTTSGTLIGNAHDNELQQIVSYRIFIIKKCTKAIINDRPKSDQCFKTMNIFFGNVNICNNKAFYCNWKTTTTSEFINLIWLWCTIWRTSWWRLDNVWYMQAMVAQWVCISYEGGQFSCDLC